MSRTALVTGGSLGIGYEIARQYAAENYNLILVARDKKNLEHAAESLKKDFNAAVTIIQSDLSEQGSGYKLFQKVEKLKQNISVLINNAGFAVSGPFTESAAEKQLGMVDVNIRALVELTWYFAGQMRKDGSGTIVNVASTAGFQPGPHLAVYYATKAFVLHFTEALHEELKDSGIKISALCPGPTKTEFFDRAGMKDTFLSSSTFSPVMRADKVARVSHRQTKRGKVIIIPGILNKIMAQSVRFTPRSIVRKIASSLNRSRT